MDFPLTLLRRTGIQETYINAMKENFHVRRHLCSTVVNRARDEAMFRVRVGIVDMDKGMNGELTVVRTRDKD